MIFVNYAFNISLKKNEKLRSNKKIDLINTKMIMTNISKNKKWNVKEL